MNALANAISVVADRIVARNDLYVGKSSISIDSITADCLRCLAAASGRRARIVVFYPQLIAQVIVLAALECLYQTNYVRSSLRHKVVVVTDFASQARDYYNSLQLDGSPLWTIFGSASDSEAIAAKKRERKRNVDSRLVIANLHKVLHFSDFRQYGAMIIGVNTTWGLGKVSAAITVGQKFFIPTIVAFEPWRHVRKARQYGQLQFQPYGWTREEVQSAVSKQSSSLVITDGSKEYLEDLPRAHIEILPHDWSSDYFQKLSASTHHLFTTESTRPYAGLIHGLFRDLLRLAAPVDLYDLECTGSFYRVPIADRIKRLSGINAEVPADQPTAQIAELGLVLKELSAKLQKDGNSKYDAMLRYLRAALVRQERTALLFSSVQERDAFEQSLARLTEPIPLDLLSRLGVSIASQDALPQVDLIHGKYSAVLSTFPSLVRADSVADWIGNWCNQAVLVLRKQEGEAYEFYLKDADNIRTSLFSRERRDDLVSGIINGRSSPSVSIPYTSPIELEEPMRSDVPSVSHRELLDILLEFEETGEIPSHRETGFTVPNIIATKPGLLIHLSEGGVLALQKRKYVYTSLDAGRVKPVRAEKLKPGDVLILVDMAVKKSLNELILDRASKYKKYRFLREMVKKWYRAFREGLSSSGDSPRVALKKLQEAGSNIKTTSGLYFWRIGLVIGPRDFEDIKRIGKIYDKPELQESYMPIVKAITDFRRLRFSILRELKLSLLSGEQEGIRRIGLDPGDFADAIEFRTTANITVSETMLCFPGSFFG